MIDLPITTSTTSLFYSSLFTPHTLLSKDLQALEPHFQQSFLPLQPRNPPILTISHSLQTLPDPILRFGYSLLFRCETDQSITLPDSISLPNADKKDEKNRINRVANCEIANIDKAATAAAVQLEAIRRLRDAGALETLPEDLRETAALREQYEELTLNELRMKFLPPISKSGLSHRLSRIIAAAKSLGNDE